MRQTIPPSFDIDPTLSQHLFDVAQGQGERTYIITTAGSPPATS